MSNAVFFTSMALFLVWMQRHQRFGAFFGALEGTVNLKGTSGQ